MIEQPNILSMHQLTIHNARVPRLEAMKESLLRSAQGRITRIIDLTNLKIDGNTGDLRLEDVKMVIARAADALGIEAVIFGENEVRVTTAGVSTFGVPHPQLRDALHQ